MRKSKINALEVVFERVIPITVVMAMYRDRETYFVFRNDNTEVEVVVSDGLCVSTSKRLTDDEAYYFSSGQYREIKDRY